VRSFLYAVKENPDAEQHKDVAPVLMQEVCDGHFFSLKQGQVHPLLS
jgi:hypothetical protein